MRASLVYGTQFEKAKGAPHFLNMSGGRSSAAMALQLAYDGQLSAQRGDVILFCNTAAEHPDTYVFADKVCAELEGLGIPTFWLEFCTVEVERRGRWSRKPWWKIVNREPWSEDNVEGFRSDGFVFEEMMSYKGMVPSPMHRMCTQLMKVETAAYVYAEWLTRSGETLGGGHDGPRQITAASKAAAYRGKLSPEKAETMFEVAYNQGVTGVPSQRWQDYTSADISRWAQGPPATTDLWERDGAVYAKLLGLRADEPKRVARILDRIIFNLGCDNSKYPPGEHLMVPLHDAGVTKQHVLEFWSNKDYDLEAPFWAGNCTFCFMKSSHGIQVGAAAEADNPTVP